MADSPETIDGRTKIPELGIRPRGIPATDPLYRLMVSRGKLGLLSVKMQQGTVQSIVAGAWRTVTLDVIDYDDFGGAAELANNRIVVPYSGIYLVFYAMGWAEDASTTARYVAFQRNATVTATRGPDYTDGSGTLRQGGNVHPVELAVGDAIGLIAFTGTTINSWAGDNLPMLAVVLLRPN
ncbi:hypothetical protein LCGC14_1628410 [marine sediment metagenome]|uniref:C1q domain-containing protein n=1 Tax=marine sediment metagenome TaxID=412755 RepID=A0A0F9I3Q2_9ZZZZ